LNRKHITALDVQPRPVLTANQWHERLTNMEHH